MPRWQRGLTRRVYQRPGRRGCVELRRARKTGTHVGLYHAEQAGWDAAGGPWVTTCETHATTCNHQTLRQAMEYLAHPDEWCEECRKIVQVRRVEALYREKYGESAR